MSKQRTEKKQPHANPEAKSAASDQHDSDHHASLTTKLERRRRIEDMNEEKRLKSELSAF